MTALAAGRRRAEARMVDTGQVTRAGTGTGAINEDTGHYPQATRTTVYDGRCRLQVRGMGSSTGTEVAGGEFTVMQTVLQLPASAGDVRIGDQFVLTGSRYMPHMVGRTYDIARLVSDKTEATKREFVVTEAGAVTS